MSLTKHWKVGKYLEWYTHLPFKDWPQTSPTFTIQNVECFFYFCREWANSSYYYSLYLKTEASDSLIKSFPVTIYINFKGSTDGPFTRKEAIVYGIISCFFSFPESQFKSEPFYLGVGYPIRYFFVFEHSVQFLLPSESETKLDEKCTQADLKLPSHTDIDYLSLDLNDLLKSRKHSDVQLQCNGGIIPAHKAILATRSKAFSDMFQDGTEENKSGLVNLTTTEISVMDLCLEYIYTGKISKFPLEKASNLYVLGHVFKICSLTKMCSDTMIAHLSKDNYIPYLVLADKYDDEYFKRGLLYYISNNADLLTKKAE